MTFLPDADATVSGVKPTNNYGGRKILRADADPEQETYLRFSVTGVSGSVTAARLRLWVTNGSADGPALYATSLGTEGDPNPWSETGITWDGRPARTSAALDDRAALSSGRFVDYDITAVFTGDGLYSFDLAGIVDGTEFASREDSKASRRPQLIVELSPAP